MTTYAKFEVSSDGDLLQSSYVIPDDGVLPVAQRSSPNPTSLKYYSQSLFPKTVTASLAGDEKAMRITGLYFPPHISGVHYLKLLGPTAAVAIVVYGIFGLLLIQTVLTPLALALVATFVISVAIFLVIYPSWWWFKWLYYQGAPTYRVQRKVQKKYIQIPIFHDMSTFLVDTAT